MKPIKPRCKLCNGNAGSLDTDGAHCLCTALAREGLPTPFLGEACEACNGNGHTIKAGQGVAFFLEGNSPGAIKRGIEAAFPKCTACGGKGQIGGAL